MPFAAASSWLLVGACICTLQSGTIYAFSAYAPQVAAKFALTSYQINLLGAAANAGAYTTGPWAGTLVDAYGSRLPLIAAAACLTGGYICLSLAFAQPEAVTKTYGHSMLKTAFLILCEFSVGVGSSIACVGATNDIAKQMPQDQRGMALAVAYSGTGISSFVYAMMAHAFFGGEATASLLALLAGGTGISVLVASTIMQRSSSAAASHEYAALKQATEEEQQALAGHSEVDMEVPEQKRPESASEPSKDITGRQLWRNIDFLLLFTYGLIVLGCGLMFINNVGTQVATLHAAPEASAITAQASITKYQTYLVTVLSLCNCAGRLVYGAAADQVQNRWRLNKALWLAVAALSLLVGQIAAKSARHPSDLLMPSALIGSAYGAFFGLAPALTADWFGVKRFSTNFGFLTVAPAVSGPLLSGVFGIIYDSHVPKDTQERHLCLLGHDCYADAFRISTALSLVAVTLALSLTLRQGLWTSATAGGNVLDTCTH